MNWGRYLHVSHTVHFNKLQLCFAAILKILRNAIYDPLLL